MCGRYTLSQPLKNIQSHFGPLVIGLEYRPSYNIAPSQFSPIIIDRSGHKGLATMKWGLVPAWAKDEKMKLINARSETAHEKPSFKNSLKNKRCLIPADGFIEWKGKDKQPYYIFLKAQALFAFAGLWSTWKSPEGQNLSTYTILTTEANERLASIHARMPVILPSDKYDTWLTLDTKLEPLRTLLTPFPSKDFDFYPVSKEVNAPRNNFAEMLERN